MSNTPLITTSAEFKRLIGTMDGITELAVDLEMDSLHNYREKVCLMQLTWNGTTVVVDPLADVGVEQLAPVLADSRVVKIFHGGDYDIRSLFRDFQLPVDNLFDTMVAAQYVGEPKIGLADLAGKYFDVALDKQYQKADWSLRPLTPEMIAYAAADTRHLSALKTILAADLERMGRAGWVAEICSVLQGARFEQDDGPRALRLKGGGKLRGIQLAILEELLQWRDREAERRDVPTFKVAGNKSLLKIAELGIQSHTALVGIEGVSPRMVDRYGSAIIAAVIRGKEMPQSEWPRFPKRERDEQSEAVKDALSRLKLWRTATAEALAIEPGMVINNAGLEAIARQVEAQTTDFSHLYRWQEREFGAGLKAALKG